MMTSNLDPENGLNYTDSHLTTLDVEMGVREPVYSPRKITLQHTRQLSYTGWYILIG